MPIQVSDQIHLSFEPTPKEPKEESQNNVVHSSLSEVLNQYLDKFTHFFEFEYKSFDEISKI